MNIEYTLERTQRKTVLLKITDEGSLVVRAPRWMGRSHIEEMILRRLSWITAKQAQMSERSQERLQNDRLSEGYYQYLGQHYPLAHAGISVTMPLATIRRLLERWYRTEALRLIARRINHYESFMQVQHSNLRITGANTRWGSCSPKGGLSFSWIS